MKWFRNLVAVLLENAHRRQVIKQARDEAAAMDRASQEFAKHYPRIAADKVSPRKCRCDNEDGNGTCHE